MVNAALKLFIVDLLQKDALPIHAAIAALNTLALNLFRHLVNPTQNVVKEVHRRALAQGRNVYQCFAKRAPVFDDKDPLAKHQCC
jgi:hypothetical protein